MQERTFASARLQCPYSRHPTPPNGMPCPPRRRCHRRTTMSTTYGTGTRPSGHWSSNGRRVAAVAQAHTQRHSSCRAACDPESTYGTTIPLCRPTTTHTSRPGTDSDRRSRCQVGIRCSGDQSAVEVEMDVVDTVALATMFPVTAHTRRNGQPMGTQCHTCLTQVNTWCRLALTLGVSSRVSKP